MSTPPYVPYQAYRPKRHSQTFSKSSVSPGPSSPRPVSLHLQQDTPSVRPVTQIQQHAPENNKNVVPNGLHIVTVPSGSAASHLTRALTPRPSVLTSEAVVPVERPASSTSQPPSVPATPSSSTSSPVMVPDDRPTASSSTNSSPTSTRTRKTSTFRHVPARAAQTPIVPSTISLGKDSRITSLSSRSLDPTKPHRPHSRLSTVTFPSDPSQAPASQDVSVGMARATSQSQSDAIQLDRRTASEATDGPSPTVLLPFPVQRTPSSTQSPTPAASAASVSPVTSPSPPSTRTSTPVRSTAPYRPGFQPKGVYRPLTDEFLEVRRSRRDFGRVEQTRLERRLEKLINLHFGEDSDKGAVARPKQAKRMSSIWELDIRSMAPGDLWRGVVQSQGTAGGKADIRASEQHITPWQSDADVSQCPLCAASFHPITNRKHHCRLCGQIICSLPVKRPQRPVTCSLLFVSDPKSGKIEEVSEGVDYGVRRRTVSSVGYGASKDGINPEEKFLRGVRICRVCRPALLRKQYVLDRARLPTFSRLYDVFMSLEKEIEDALPQFHELLLTLNSDDRPTAEASAARKRLLDAFAQYDALAKRIRVLPTSGPGSSQDRVLAAVHTRANVFLQKHMFPLQSLPRPSKSTSLHTKTIDGPVIDPDSEVAHAIQPLLEQEALLESFIEEAKAHRKFEDAKSLKNNLHEIQVEIDKIVANGHEGGLMIPQPDGKSKKLTG